MVGKKFPLNEEGAFSFIVFFQEAFFNKIISILKILIEYFFNQVNNYLPDVSVILVHLVVISVIFFWMTSVICKISVPNWYDVIIVITHSHRNDISLYIKQTKDFDLVTVDVYIDCINFTLDHNLGTQQANTALLLQAQPRKLVAAGHWALVIVHQSPVQNHKLLLKFRV